MTLWLFYSLERNLERILSCALIRQKIGSQSPFGPVRKSYTSCLCTKYDDDDDDDDDDDNNNNNNNNNNNTIIGN